MRPGRPGRGLAIRLKFPEYATRENGSGARDSPEISRICDPENGSGVRNLRGISRICDPETGSGLAICAEFLEYATRKPGRGFTNCPEFLRYVTRLGGSCPNHLTHRIGFAFRAFAIRAVWVANNARATTRRTRHCRIPAERDVAYAD